VDQVKEIPHVGYIKQKTWFARSRAATSFPISALLSTYMHSLQQANSRKKISSALQLVNIFPSNLAGLALNNYQKKKLVTFEKLLRCTLYITNKKVQLNKNNYAQTFRENREIRNFTLSLGILSPPNPSLSGICKVRKFY
jgi:hypothetical protein